MIGRTPARDHKADLIPGKRGACKRHLYRFCGGLRIGIFRGGLSLLGAGIFGFSDVIERQNSAPVADSHAFHDPLVVGFDAQRF